MKLKELNILLEAQNADQVYERYYSDIDREVFDQIVKADTVDSRVDDDGNIKKVGAGAKWLLKIYREGNLNIEDLYKFADDYKALKRYKEKLPEAQRDLMKIKSLGELASLIDTYTRGQSNPDHMTKKDKLEATKVIYECDSWIMYHPLTYEASNKLGKNPDGNPTKWCTNIKHNYEYYSKDGPLLVIVSKLDAWDRWQLHFESKQLMDRFDKPAKMHSVPEAANIFYAIEAMLSKNWYQNKTKDPVNGYAMMVRVMAETNNEEESNKIFKWVYEDGRQMVDEKTTAALQLALYDKTSPHGDTRDNIDKKWIAEQMKDPEALKVFNACIYLKYILDYKDYASLLIRYKKEGNYDDISEALATGLEEIDSEEYIINLCIAILETDKDFKLNDIRTTSMSSLFNKFISCYIFKYEKKIQEGVVPEKFGLVQSELEKYDGKAISNIYLNHFASLIHVLYNKEGVEYCARLIRRRLSYDSYSTESYGWRYGNLLIQLKIEFQSSRIAVEILSKTNFVFGDDRDVEKIVDRLIKAGRGFLDLLNELGDEIESRVDIGRIHLSTEIARLINYGGITKHQLGDLADAVYTMTKNKKDFGYALANIVMNVHRKYADEELIEQLFGRHLHIPSVKNGLYFLAVNVGKSAGMIANYLASHNIKVNDTSPIQMKSSAMSNRLIDNIYEIDDVEEKAKYIKNVLSAEDPAYAKEVLQYMLQEGNETNNEEIVKIASELLTKIR